MAKKNPLLEAVMARTKQNVVKGRGGSGKTTYLDRFVDVLTDEDGNPVPPMKRTELIAHISFQILEEQLEGRETPFELTEAGDTEDDILLAEINRKVKSQVANAVADNNNSTSISYNEKYKDKWEVVKDGDMISLVAK